MNAENVRGDLRYDRADLKSIRRYARAHNVERDGRYDLRMPPWLNIWTHAWTNLARRMGSTLTFSLDFDRHAASLMSVWLQPGVGGTIFLDEPAKLERAALGDTVYGRRRAEPIV